jgi:hypothetical protein
MFRFYCNCVDWPEADVNVPGGLCDLIDARKQISRRSFLKHVNRDDLRSLEEKTLGYHRFASTGLTMAGDWHVEYFRSTLHGSTVYGFRHSAIEYVFCETASTVKTCKRCGKPFDPLGGEGRDKCVACIKQERADANLQEMAFSGWQRGGI